MLFSLVIFSLLVSLPFPGESSRIKSSYALFRKSAKSSLFFSVVCFSVFVGISGVCGGEGLAFVGFEFETCEDRGGIEVVKRRLER